MNYENLIRERLSELEKENSELKAQLDKSIKIDADNILSLIQKIEKLEKLVGEVVNNQFALDSTGVTVDEDSFFALKEFINHRQ